VFTDPYLNLDPWVLWLAGVGFGFLPAFLWGVKGGLRSFAALAVVLFVAGFLTMFTAWIAAIVIAPVTAVGGWVGLAVKAGWLKFGRQA
jgi:hypothetical protein